MADRPRGFGVEHRAGADQGAENDAHHDADADGALGLAVVALVDQGEPAADEQARARAPGDVQRKVVPVALQGELKLALPAGQPTAVHRCEGFVDEFVAFGEILLRKRSAEFVPAGLEELILVLDKELVPLQRLIEELRLRHEPRPQGEQQEKHGRQRQDFQVNGLLHDLLVRLCRGCAFHRNDAKPMHRARPAGRFSMPPGRPGRRPLISMRESTGGARARPR